MLMIQDGIEVYCLPDGACCEVDENHRSPLDLDDCPLGYETCNTQSDLRLEDKDGKNPEMQEIWGLQRLWGHPLGRNTSVGNQNIYNGT